MAENKNSDVPILESVFHEKVWLLYEWVDKCKQQLKEGMYQPKELELELSLRPMTPFTDQSGRTADIGKPLYSHWKEWLGTLTPSAVHHEKRAYVDYFYLDQTIRERAFSDTNQMHEWTRKCNLPFIYSPLQLNFQDCKLQMKAHLKQERPVLPLPHDVSPVFARSKTTHRYRLHAHPGCTIDLSEVQNIRYYAEEKRSCEEGSVIYEMEIELDSSTIFNSDSEDRSWTYKMLQCRSDIWLLCGEAMTQVHELVNQLGQ
ncbi:MAG: hypothetical protein Sylvanvirus1_70 [Sylvanvirus sp.]|uniref:mRNA 5'-phosphatase n=1 Tax=Sylvanvirus sp. TaxID=2487774 RepID=A0A3G5AIQ0_9VIRU|nr:MAG: hypothetical protein Sylvanvirus1_70 [Sylvanvirus sp.]